MPPRTASTALIAWSQGVNYVLMSLEDYKSKIEYDELLSVPRRSYKNTKKKA